MRKTFISLLIVTILLVGLIQAGQASGYETPQPSPQTEETTGGSCYSLDVIFVIDQSTSMSGVGGMPPSDPNGWRVEAAKAMIKLLAETSYSTCPDTLHRVGVISYGTRVGTPLGYPEPEKADLVLQLTEINADSLNSAINISKDYSDKLKAVTLGETDPLNAFRYAKGMLDAARNVSHYDKLPTPRKQVIFHVTDGIPCVASLGCRGAEAGGNDSMDFIAYMKQTRAYMQTAFPMAKSLVDQQRCLDKLDLYYESNPKDEDINTCLKENPVKDEEYRDSTYFYTILMKSQDYKPLDMAKASLLESINDIWEDISEDHAGKFIDLNDPEDNPDGTSEIAIPSIFRKEISRLAGIPNIVMDCGSFAVNPYMDSATLTFYKFNKDVKVHLSYSDVAGNVYDLEDNIKPNGGFDVLEHTEGLIEQYVIRNPYPGIWNLVSDCKSLSAYYKPSQVVPVVTTRIGNSTEMGMAEVAQYKTPPYYDETFPLKIITELNANGEVVAPPDIQYLGLQLTATVSTPSGSTTSYPMVYDPAEKKYATSDPIQVPEDGKYTITVVGVTHIYEGESPTVDTTKIEDVFNVEKTIFTDNSQTFSVYPVYRFHVVPQGRVVENAHIFDVHSSILRGWPLKPNNIPVRVQVQKSPDDPALPALSSVFTSNADAPFSAYVQTADGLHECRKNDPVLLRADSSIENGFSGVIPDCELSGNLQIVITTIAQTVRDHQPANAITTINITRSDDTIWSQALTYNILMWILIAILVGIIIYNIIIRLNPLRGTIVFSAAGATIAQYALNSGTYRYSISKASLASMKDELSLKWMRIESIPPFQKPKKAKLDSVWGDGDGTTDTLGSVRIIGECLSGKKIDMTLVAGNPTDYCDDALATVEFFGPEMSIE